MGKLSHKSASHRTNGLIDECIDAQVAIVLGLVADPQLATLLAWISSDFSDLIAGFSRATRSCCDSTGDDLTGHVSRNVRIVESMETLLRVDKAAGNELYHYHTKLIMKDAGKGSVAGGGSGRFAWHQDYGYWYNNGCLFPEMATVMIAIDRCYPGNGCLEVLPGSHKVGRIEHTLVGEQTGADMERVSQLQTRFPLKHVELEPGDACFFHCNLLHQSGRNTSEDRRWCFLVSFNTKHNDPVYAHHHPKYNPLDRLPEDSILAAAEGLPVDPDAKDFMVPVTYIKDGVTKEVAEQWQARDGASSGVQMTSTAAARRAIAEATRVEAGDVDVDVGADAGAAAASSSTA